MRSRLFCCLALCALNAAAADLPLGHPNFTPSPTQPAGWRGDGNGRFPGATPVTDWDLQTGKNVIWKTKLPWFSCSGPIVVAGKVFTTAEPDRLICVDARTGVVLWERHTNPAMEKLPAAKQKELYELTDRLLDLREEIQRWTAYMDEGERDPKAAAEEAAKRSRNVDSVKAISQLSGGDGGGYFKQNEAGVTRFMAERKDTIAKIVGSADLREIRKMHARVSKSAWSTATTKGLSLEEMEDAAKRPMTTKQMPPNEVDLIDNAWWNSFGNTFPTPASDGTYVVCKTGRTDAWNRLVCYDLEGNRQWAVDIGGEGFWHAAVSSPVIAEGLVICHDTRDIVQADGKRQRNVSCLAAFDLQKAFRVTDGRCLAPSIAGTNGAGDTYTLDADFDTPVWDGKDALFCTAQCSSVKDQRDGPRCGWRLRWQDANTLAAELIFHEVERKGLGWVRGSILQQDGILYRHNGANGRNQMKGVVMKDRSYISCRSAQPEWHVSGPKPLGQAWPNEDNMSAAIGGAYYFGGLTKVPTQFMIATLGPDPRLVSEPVLDGPMCGSIWFQGDRMYMRTYRYLYCFGPKP